MTREEKAAYMKAWYAKNKEQRKEYNRTYYAANPKQKRKERLRNLYGIEQEQYDTMLADQEGRCAICNEKPSANLYVDHCHQTSAVRGLLCRECNIGLGLFKDDSARLAKAIEYLAPGG